MEPLNLIEMIYIYVKAMEIYRTEDNETLKKDQLQALLNRVLFKENTQEISLRKAFLLRKAEITKGTDQLEMFLPLPVCIDEDIFYEPITFRFDLLIITARSLIAKFDYTAAFELIRNYQIFSEKIECLI